MFAHTRSDALARLQDFIPVSGKYSRDRNHVFPFEHANVLRLSPAIRHRLLTEQEAAQAPLARYAPSTIEKFTQEIYWRRYWKSWLSLRPQVWTDYLSELDGLNNPSSPSLTEKELTRLEQVKKGESGLAIMDLFTRELIETGYLHNHARMWWAAWWVHLEQLPWQLGAAFFYQHLLDADPASNTLSWRWVAGLQTPGKTYLPRRSNLEKYLPAELLAEYSEGLNLLEKPQALSLELPPKPEITRRELPASTFQEGQKTVLLIHEEDLSPEFLTWDELPFEEVWCLAHRASWLKLGYAPKKIAWTEAALHDAQTRAREHFPHAQHRNDLTELTPALGGELRAAGFTQALTLRPEVGPLQTSLAELTTHSTLNWHWIDRPEDLQLRPLATAGFFGFWKKVQKLTTPQANK